jgi:hypothetical protein
MTNIREQILSSAELDEAIKKFEEKYGRTTLDFFRDPSTVSDDDAFEWQAYVSLKADLDEVENDIRRGYLQQVSQISTGAEPAAWEKQVLLAA